MIVTCFKDKRAYLLYLNGTKTNLFISTIATITTSRFNLNGRLLLKDFHCIFILKINFYLTKNQNIYKQNACYKKLL